MKLRKTTLKNLAEMICGNEPYFHFPYRSSSYLTRFFFDIELEYEHNGSTRSQWVETVLSELNDKSIEADKFPSAEICKVIEHLIFPDHFLNDTKYDHIKATEDLNKALKSSGLILQTEWDGQSKVALLNGEFISTAVKNTGSIKHITFSPSVFKVPEKPLNDKLISVMMPFNRSFDGTFSAIKRVADHTEIGFECLRADDIWNNSIFIQDIFDLIYCARIVIVDFTGRNPNVMYETGIAHTLGKEVIPICQNFEDIPSDLLHHRALKYLPNDEGYRTLSNELFKRIKAITEGA